MKVSFVEVAENTTTSQIDDDDGCFAFKVF